MLTEEDGVNNDIYNESSASNKIKGCEIMKWIIDSLVFFLSWEI